MTSLAEVTSNDSRGYCSTVLVFVRQVLRYFDYFFTTVFTIEIAVKVSTFHRHTVVCNFSHAKYVTK